MKQMAEAKQWHTRTRSTDCLCLPAPALGTLFVVLCLLFLPAMATQANASSRLTALLSLPAKHERQAREEIKRFFPAEDYEVDIESLDQFIARETVYRSSHVGAGEIVLAAGSRSCHYALTEMPWHPVMCVLLSRQSFQQITQGGLGSQRQKPYSAIVIDQPVKRQLLIASTVFPSLKHFGVLASEGNARLQKARDCPRVQVNTYDENGALAPQLADIMSDTDALIALPDNNVYSTERLRTVLLTAYGYAKPVIGYSPSYVKAGALISTFTTTRQVFRQAAELLQVSLDFADDRSVVYEPLYFSITDNSSIAKSLGLVRRFRYSTERDYTDEDFSS